MILTLWSETLGKFKSQTYASPHLLGIYYYFFLFHSENIQYNLTLKRKQQENTCEIRRCKILVSNFPKVSLHSVKIKLIATFTLLPESQPSSSTIILIFWERFYTNMVHDVTRPDCKGSRTLIIDKLLNWQVSYWQVSCSLFCYIYIFQ